jgi:type II secretory pathway pseudopilin PulG/uncharacterized membrane protein (UPF0136 family)
MRTLIPLMLCLLLPVTPHTAGVASVKEPSPATVTVNAVRYDGKLAEHEARFTVHLDLESSGNEETRLTLCEGELAVLPAKLPSGLRLAREGNQYQLIVARSGRHQVTLELVAKVTRAEPWNQVSFTGPAAGIASVVAEATSSGMEVQLLCGIPDAGSTPPDATTSPRNVVRGLLGSERTVAVRWQSKAAEAARKALANCEATTTVKFTPGVIQFATELRYEILQGALPGFAVVLPPEHALTRVEGEQIRDWQIAMVDGRPTLKVELIKPVEKAYSLCLASEQAVEGLPFTGALGLPQPQDVDRESGLLTLRVEDVMIETPAATGLRQINAPEGALAAYRFHGRAPAFEVRLRRLEPVIHTTDRVTVRVEDARLQILHALTLNVEKAGICVAELLPVQDFLVTEVKGEGIADWSARDSKLVVNFLSRVLGSRTIEVHLEKTHTELPPTFTVAPLRLVSAVKETAQVGAAAAPGIQLKTARLSGVREIPIARLERRADELLAFTADQPDWTIQLAAEQLPPRTIADIFNLITIGDGLLGGSATIRYVVINQGVQEFRVSLPARWKNVDFTGPNLRRKELLPSAGANADTNFVTWSIALQDKAWGGYTLVVTYDEAFDPHQAILQLGGLHALAVERETGTVAVTSAAGLQLRATRVDGPLRRIDESELVDSDRALITRSVLLAYRYGSADPYDLAVEVTRFPAQPVLEAVADRVQLTTVLTEAGQMLTQASFMVKNNEKQFQRFILPKGAEFWSAYVDGQPAKAEQQADALLVPLPRGEDRDRAFAVEIVYAQKVDSLVSLRPRDLALSAPRTEDLQTTYAEWELFVPGTHHLRHFGGNMTVAEGTIYGLRDALREFAEVYRDALRQSAGVLTALVVLGLVALLVVSAVRHRRLVDVLVVVTILAVLAGMLLPAMARAKARAQQVSAVNNLKQIGLALRIHSGDNRDSSFPASLDQLRAELGSERVLIDPVSGRRFIYVGASRSDTDPNAVVAYSPTDVGGRAVLLADGSVQQMTEARFVEALRLSGQLAQTTSAPAQGLAVGAVPGIQVRPELPGLRPLRIDLPRRGARFVFTKVLNVGQNPLAVEAWVVTTKTWNRMRSALEVTVFLGGLFLLWRQLRRPVPRSLIVALALGLVLGGTGSLLLAERALGLALVIAVPLVALGAAILIGRRLWQWRAARHRPEAADGAMPTESAGASPVTPLVALLLLLPIGQALAAEEGSVAQSVASTVKPTIESVTLLSAEYSGTVHERVAQVEAVISLSAGKPGQVVPLFGEDVAVEEFSATPRAVRLVREGKCVSVRLPKAGPATVRVKFLVKLEGDVTRRRLAFGVPAALSSRVTLTVQEPEAVVEFPTAVSHHSSTAQEQTRIEAVLGAADRVELAWTPRVKRAAEIAATVFCQNATLATFSSGVLNLRSQLEYQVTQGELREVRVRLPAGHRLLRVEGEHLRTWQIKSGASSGPAAESEQILTVELIKGVSPSYRLTVETERALDPPPSSVAVKLPHALDVKRETGCIALSGSDDLALAADAPSGLQKVDLAEFTKAFATPQALTAAYQFLRPDFGLTVRVETLQPQIEAVVRNRLRLGADQLHLTTHVDYTIKRAGLFALRLWVPTDFRVESVTGPDLAQWVERTESGRRIVEVTLKQRISGAYALQLQLVQPLPALPASLDVPGVHPLDTTKLTGFVVVSPEPGVQIKPGAREGLTEVPVASVPEGGAGLAYRYLSNDPAPATAPWRLRVSSEAVESWIRAEVMTWLTLSETLASGRALVRFEVQNAPVKEFRLRIPAAFRNVEIEGANVRRRDQEGEEWRVELQSKVVGTHTLTVTWEQPWSVREEAKKSRFDVTGVEALGVERETGAVAVIARAPLEVTPHAASAELIRLDVRELPEWGGRADPDPVLAYRYLRPGYQLALTAQRFAPAAVLQALVQEARLTTVVADDGQMMTELALRLRNNGRQFLEVALPVGAQLWSAFVAGQAVRPGVRNGKLLLPLEGDAGGLISLELTYVGTGVFPHARGQVQLASPALDVPIQNARWDLYLPADYGYRGFGGTMTHEASATPVYRSFTLTEYQQVEQDNWKNRDQQASSSLDDALSKIKSGRLDEANKAYQVARRYGLKGGKKEAVQLEQELRRAQSGNLLNAQQALIANNAAFVNQSAGQPAPAQQARTHSDDAAAEQQWVKLQQAQEVTTASAKPLKVNLPTRGLRHSFSQALQTEVGKPMLVQFVAVSANAASWPMRLGGAVLAFAALWGVAAGLLRTLGSARQTA